MPTFGVTAAGFVPMRLADVQAALTALFQSAFGPSVDLDARTPLGQILGILAEQLANGWEIDEQVYGMYSPDTAFGAVLDNLCSITNITRLPATYSQGFITITGSNGTVIPGTFQVSVSGNPTAIFQVTSGGIISGTTITLPVMATATGPLAAPMGSLTVIVTPVSGVTAVTNAADATVGTNTETDAALRIRRLISLSRAGTATLNGIYNALMNVSEVVQASVVENATDSEDGAGRGKRAVGRRHILLHEEEIVLRHCPVYLRFLTWRERKIKVLLRPRACRHAAGVPRKDSACRVVFACLEGAE